MIDFTPNTTTLGFTGTREITTAEEESIARILRTPSLDLDHYQAFVTGACIGVDAYVGGLMARWFPTAEHIVVVPADRSRVDPSYLSWASHIINMPTNTTYKDRNQRIVELINKLVGFPRYTEQDPRSIRSGSWQTVRISRTQGVTYKVFPLDHLSEEEDDIKAP